MSRHFILIGALLLAFASIALPQDPEAIPGGSDAPTVDFIKTEAEVAAARTDLSEEVKKQIQQNYTAALALLESTALNDSKSDADREALNSAPAETKVAAAELETIPTSIAPDALVSAKEQALDVAQRKDLLVGEEAVLAKSGSGIGELETALASETARASKFAEELVHTQERLRVAVKDIATVQNATEPLEIAEQVRLRAQVAAIRSEVSALELERASSPVRIAFLKARRDLHTRKVSRQEARVDILQALVKAGVEAVVSEAERTVTANGVVKPGTLAAEITGYASQLRSAANRLTTVRRDQLALSKQLAKLTSDYALVVRQVEATGGTGAAAQILLDQHPPFPRPPVRPDGWFRGQPSEANS